MFSFMFRPPVSVVALCDVLGAAGAGVNGTACMACPAGRYGSLPGALGCELCPLGTFNAFDGASSEGNCQPCSSINPRMTTLESGATSNASCVCMVQPMA